MPYPPSYILQIMQKASAGFDRAKDVEKDLKKEQKRTEKAERESAQNAQSLKDAREEVEKLKADLAEQKRKADNTEQRLRRDLIEAEAKAESEYDRAVLEVTANYRAQMPAVKDAVWGASWVRCCTKMGLPEDSPMWTDMELPSEMGTLAAQQPQTEGANPDAFSNAQSEVEPLALNEGVIDLTEQVGNDGNEAVEDPVDPKENEIADPNPAIDASQHGEEV